MNTLQAALRATFAAALTVGLFGFAPAASAEDIGDTIEKYVGKTESMMGIYDSWNDFSAAHDALVPDDRQFEPDYTPPGSPTVPSSCAGSEKCNECYEQAVRKINFYRFSLDKGKSITNNAIQYAKKAMAFGDTGSAAMGVGGLGWTHKAKPQIEKSVLKIRKTYKGKYEEWIAGMQTSLQELGKCEAQFFNERDWYSRYGYVYYSFMADRYKNPD